MDNTMQSFNTLHNDMLTDIAPNTWFRNHIKFRVPVYQRLFTWETPQFDRLLSDLVGWKKEEPYYLGIITVVKAKDIDTCILIDGQQRLTVIAILMGMFKRDLCLEESPLTYLDYEARPNDRQALETIWEKGSFWLEQNQEDIYNELNECNVLSDSMRLFVTHIFEKKDIYKSLIMDIYEKLHLLISWLPDDYKDNIYLQNEYFEKMNSAGKQLEPHEILKIQICKGEGDFDNWNSVEDFSRRFEDREENHVSEFSMINVIDGERADDNSIRVNGNTITFSSSNEIKRTTIEKWRPSLVVFPMMLLHVLKLIGIINNDKKFSLPSDPHTLLKCFEGRNKSNFVDCMCDYRRFLDEWIIHKDIDFCDKQENNKYDDISYFSYWSKKSKNTEIKVIESDFSRELKQIQMALYAIGDQKQEWILYAYRAFGKIKQKTSKNLLIILVKHLIKKADFDIMKLSGDLWPDDYLTYNTISHAQFVCLDFFLWLLANSDSKEDKELRTDIFGDKVPKAIICFIPKANKSVEHFHPQTDVNSQKEGWENSIHLFGNLALISAGRNSEYGNQSVAAKSERIELLEERNALESIKLYLMMQECQKKEQKWTPNCARSHAKKMLHVLQWGLIALPNRYREKSNEI